MNNTIYNTDSVINKGERVKLPTKYGNFHLVPFQEVDSRIEHVALLKGNPKPTDVVLTRVHSSCATGDLFGSLRCDCGEQLHKAMELIEKKGLGVIIYLQQEGRGIGLMNKIKAYKLQEKGVDTVDANIHLGFAPDERNYQIGAKILKALNIHKIRLLTNNPAKISGLEEFGIQIIDRQELMLESNAYNEKYLKTKQARMGHVFELVTETF